MPKTPKKTTKPDSTAKKRKTTRPKRIEGASSKPRRTRSRAASAKAAVARKPKIAVAPLVAEVLAPTVEARDRSLETVMIAVDAARAKLAKNMLLLDLRSMADFTDFFFICSGTNPRQVQAICDEITLQMKQAGLRAAHTEGYNHAEWVLLDYVDFVAHIFTEQAREYYDLERLWKTADRVPLGEKVADREASGSAG